MNRLRLARSLAAAIIAATPGIAGSAIANDVTFIDGGYAEMCSSAAHNIGTAQPIELTGSRMSIPPIEICTLAIRDEAGTVTDKAGSYNNRGVLLFEAGMLEESLRDFDAAIDVVDTMAAAHINRGYTLVALQRWADSIPAFDRGISLGAPDPARAHFNRGIAHEEIGNVRAAYYDYMAASKLSPEWEEPKRELARFTVR